LTMSVFGPAVTARARSPEAPQDWVKVTPAPVGVAWTGWISFERAALGVE